MPRPKKNFVTAAATALTVTQSEEPEHDAIVGQLARHIGNFGFRQILPPPIEDRKTFLRHPRLERHFGSKLLEVSLASEELTLPPTHLLGVFKRYLRNLKTRGPHVSKWFFVSPAAALDEDKMTTNHEVGIFSLGSDSAIAHTQLISSVGHLLGEFGIPQFLIEINNLGCNGCQKDYHNLLQDHFRKGSFDLCSNCNANLAENPLEIWNCLNLTCRQVAGGAPQIVDFLDEACRSSLIGILETMDGLNLPYTLNPGLSSPFLQEKVIFRITVPGSDGVTLGHGGNYATWANYLGSEPVPLIGFMTTLEKLWDLVPLEKRSGQSKVDVFLIPLGEVASRRTLVLQRDLQQSGVAVAEAMIENPGIKNQLKEAQDRHSEIALIMGQKEAIDETVILRDIRSGMQEVFAYDRIVEEVKKRLGK